MNKYELRTQKKKDAIIEASLNLFREKGYSNSSIHEIAATAHVSAVSIYNYFGSKESLVRECVAKLLQQTTEMVLELLSEPRSFKDRLLDAVSLCAQKPHELMEEYFSQEALADAVFLELLGQSISTLRLDILASFIACGKAEGAIPATISTETILGLLDAASKLQTQWETTADFKHKSAELYHLVLYGLIGH